MQNRLALGHWSRGCQPERMSADSRARHNACLFRCAGWVLGAQWRLSCWRALMPLNLTEVDDATASSIVSGTIVFIFPPTRPNSAANRHLVDKLPAGQFFVELKSV